MLKVSLIALTVLAGAGVTYKLVAEDTCPACETAAAQVITADASTPPSTAPATAPALVDVKNTKCVVMPDDTASEKTVEYKGKLYHLCCSECVESFNKDPKKFVDALEANPAKYGVGK